MISMAYKLNVYTLTYVTCKLAVYTVKDTRPRRMVYTYGYVYTRQLKAPDVWRSEASKLKGHLCEAGVQQTKENPPSFRWMGRWLEG